jgi:hypothetical protein
MQDKNGPDPGHLVLGTWYLAPMPNFPTSRPPIVEVAE